MGTRRSHGTPDQPEGHGAASLDEEQPARSAARGIDGGGRGVQALRALEPWADAAVHIEDERAIGVVEVAGDGGVVTAAPAEEQATIEVEDVAPPRIVGAQELGAEGAEI